MGGAITAELRKFFTTRMWWGLATGVFLSGGALAAVFALLVPGSRTQGPAVRAARGIPAWTTPPWSQPSTPRG